MAKDIIDIALRHLEHRERSKFEMKKHLKEKGFSEDEIQETISYLEEFRYVDDERYCESYIKYALSKGKGKVRIRQELSEKGITGELLQLALEEQVDSTLEWDNAMMQAQKILRISGVSRGEDGKLELDEKLKAKIGRRLSGLGYSTGMIYDVIGKL